MTTAPPTSRELTIIVPTYNEALALPALLESLASLADVDFEVIVSDGGSTDATCEVAATLARSLNLHLRVINGSPGRGDQLNRGAAESTAEYLLFLHADSRFEDAQALRRGIANIAGAQQEHAIVGGHYALRFARSKAEHSLAYYYYECKARLDRPDCTHGDQGLLLPRSVYLRVGPFVNFPPMLAETRLANRVRELGVLRLLPAQIITSARRFETEGLYPRQVLNAILMCCADQSWDAPFHTLTGLYRTQAHSGQLQLAPMLDALRQLIAKLPPGERRQFWRQTGAYVRRNAWQLAFALDVRHGYRLQQTPGELRPITLSRFDRHWDRLTDHALGQWAASILAGCWFALTRWHSRRSESESQQK